MDGRSGKVLSPRPELSPAAPSTAERLFALLQREHEALVASLLADLRLRRARRALRRRLSG